VHAVTSSIPPQGRHLIGAIEFLADHKPFFTANVSQEPLDLSRPARERSALTYRERGVGQLVAESYTNKPIAGFLDVSLKAFETHGLASYFSLLPPSSFDTRYA
jgi:DNA-binding NarL/FixJ family response regulator